jgi:hypothetical protein
MLQPAERWAQTEKRFIQTARYQRYGDLEGGKVAEKGAYGFEFARCRTEIAGEASKIPKRRNNLGLLSS